MIDNIGNIVYYLIKIRDKEKPKMTKREIEEKANEIVKTNNEKYEALKNKDVESYEKLHELEAILILSFERKGYEITYVYDETEPLVSFGGKRALKAVGSSISEMKEENKWY